MHKIIAAFDGLKYSTATERAAITIAKQGGNHLTAVFLDDFTYTSYKLKELIEKNEISEKKLREYSEKDKETRNESVAAFEQACRNAGVEFNIHRDRNICTQDLLHESVYADLLIISQEEAFSNYDKNVPTRFIREMLGEVQCPVFLVSENDLTPRKLALLYDGGPASVYAIKMFSYLFPTLAQLPAEVIAAKGYYEDLHLPDNRLMKELVKRHYPNTVYTVLQGDVQVKIVDHLKKEKEPVLIVMGDNRRGTVSRLFKQRMVDILMKELQAPIFMTHHK